MIWLGSAFAYAAVVAFALAMPVHHRSVLGAPPRRTRMTWLRVAGVGLASCAASAFVAAQGGQVGVVTFLAALSAAGFGLTLLLSHRPRWIAWPAVGCLLIAALRSLMA